MCIAQRFPSERPRSLKVVYFFSLKTETSLSFLRIFMQFVDSNALGMYMLDVRCEADDENEV